MMRYRAIRKGGSLKMSDAAGVSPSHHSASCTGLLAFSLYISVCEQTKLEGDSVPWEAGTEGGHSNTLGLRARPSNSIGTRAELTHISHPKHLGCAIGTRRKCRPPGPNRQAQRGAAAGLSSRLVQLASSSPTADTTREYRAKCADTATGDYLGRRPKRQNHPHCPCDDDKAELAGILGRRPDWRKHLLPECACLHLLKLCCGWLAPSSPTTVKAARRNGTIVMC
eukprot:1908695-Rhodomonas_salina.1